MSCKNTPDPFPQLVHCTISIIHVLCYLAGKLHMMSGLQYLLLPAQATHFMSVIYVFYTFGRINSHKKKSCVSVCSALLPLDLVPAWFFFSSHLVQLMKIGAHRKWETMDNNGCPTHLIVIGYVGKRIIMQLMFSLFGNNSLKTEH